MKYNYIVWDWNGTLFNDVDVCFKTINKHLEKNNLRNIKSLDDYKNIFGFPIREYYEKLGFNNDDFETLAEEYMVDYLEISAECGLYDGTEKVLDDIKSMGIKQLVISASEQGILEKQIKKFNIEKYFYKLLGLTDNYAHSKVALAERWTVEEKINNDEVLFIGDTVHDYEVADNAGCRCLLIANGHQSKKILESVNTNVVDTIKEVTKYIKEN